MNKNIYFGSQTQTVTNHKQKILMKNQRMKTSKPQRVKKQRPKCVVCNKVLKVFERNLCSCKIPVCMSHKQRLLHACPLQTTGKVDLVKIVAPKVIKI